jgi:hypothetical protein
MKISVKILDIDDVLFYKRSEIRVEGKRLETPLQTSDISRVSTPINEILKKFSYDKLRKISENERYEREENYMIRRKLTDRTNFLLTDYTSLNIPEEKHIEILSDLQYSYSDVVITPIWSSITREFKKDKLRETFIALVNKYIEIVETLNDKTIIGLIPSRIPRHYLEDLVDNYIDKDITSFVIDCDGRSIEGNLSWIRDLMRLMAENDILERSFLYAVNQYQGRFLKNSLKIPAKDFISIGFGIDILGLNHNPPRMPPKAWEKIKRQRQMNIYRLFDRDDYSYTRYTESNVLHKLGLRNVNIRDQIRGMNISEQHSEALYLQQKLKEENTVESYVKHKSQFEGKTLEKIKKLRKETFGPVSRSLEDYL